MNLSFNLPFVIGFIMIAFIPYYRGKQVGKKMSLRIYLLLLLVGSLLVAGGALLDRNWIILGFDSILVLVVAYDTIKLFTGKMTRYEKDIVSKEYQAERERAEKRQRDPHFIDPDLKDII